MKIEEASVFLSSFKNGRARGLVKKMMLQHYTDAVLEHHPESVAREHIF